MSIYSCACGRKTTEPFIIGGVRYCTICAEDLRPDLVANRERSNQRKFSRRQGPDGHSYDFGKHSSR